MEAKRRVHWTAGIVSLVLVSLVILAVWVSSQVAMVPRMSEMWSRGKVIGQTSVKQRVALRVAPDGGMFLIWQNLEKQLELARVGTDGKVLLNRVLPINAKEAGDPQLHVGSDGRLHLLWREGEYPRSTVRYVLLDGEGTLLHQPQTLSDPAAPVMDAPQLVVDTRGHYHAVWADDVGVQWTKLSAEGTMVGSPTLLAPGGRFPTVQVDDQGRLHLAWQRQERVHVESVYYVAFDPESGVVDQPEEIVRILLHAGERLREPAISLTPEMVYVLWTVQDFKYVASVGGYAYFPLGAPQQKQVEELQLRQGRYPVGVYSPDGLGEVPLIVLSESISDPETEQVRSQIALLALEQKSQEDVVTNSSQASLKPILVEDDRSYLHLAWLESAGFGEYQVVYASTAPSILKRYNALTVVDVSDVVFSNIFRLSTMAVSLVGSLITWVSVPFVGLLLYHLVTSEETLSTRRSWVAVIAALAGEVVLTFALPPNIGVDVTGSVLRWIVPAASAIVTVAVTARVVRRQTEAHLFGTFFQFTAMNSVLQTALFLLF